MFSEILKSLNTDKEFKNNKAIQAYLQSLQDDEKQVFLIAHQHLESSFNVLKSIGYQTYINKR